MGIRLSVQDDSKTFELVLNASVNESYANLMTTIGENEATVELGSELLRDQVHQISDSNVI